MESLYIFWGFIVAISAVAEALTTQLVSIWFMVGGLFALAVSLFNLSFFLQLGIFIITSVTMIILVRPYIKNMLKFKVQKTNVDRLIGKVATVTEEINNLNEKGAVTVSGMVWTARSSDGKIISKGERVKIDSISGVKMIVHQV